MNVGIVGLGLIGGSLAKALKERTSHTVYASDRNKSVFLRAKLEAAVDAKLDETTLPQCDVIFLALYPHNTIDYLRTNATLFSKGAIVMDCCGVKQTLCSEAFPIAQAHGFTFIGGHPMAGTAAFGFESSKGTMFHNAPMILCPAPGTPIETLDKVRKLCLELGFSRTPRVSPEEHDRMIAYTSQLAHVVSSAYVRSTASQDHRNFSAGSFRDMTRVAKLNAPMWAELFLENRNFLADEIDSLCARMKEYSAALRGGDEAALLNLLEEGTEAKRRADERD